MNILDEIEYEMQRVRDIIRMESSIAEQKGKKCRDLSMHYVAEGEALIALECGETIEIVEAYNNLKKLN